MARIEAYSAEEAGKILHVQGRTVRQWIADGKIKGVRVGRRWIITREALEDYLEENTYRPEGASGNGGNPST